MKDVSEREAQYTNIVDDILNHKEFIKTKDITHHGMNRFDHSVRVSYYSYKISKMLGLDSEASARGGLLHDFFLVDNGVISKKEKMNTLVNHPKYAAMLAEKYFDISDKEKDVILTHMFPVAINRVPKYAESWVVSSVDKAVSICEVAYRNYGHAASLANVMLIVLINYLKL